MTGFGRGEALAGGWRYTVELSSVNRKQSDIAVSLPREWSEHEAEVRQLIAAEVSRGRVNAVFKVEPLRGSRAALRYDAALAQQYLKALGALERALRRPVDIEATDLLRAPGVFSLESMGADPQEGAAHLRSALKKALAALERSRRREGAALRRDLAARLRRLVTAERAISRLAPRHRERLRESLARRLREAGLPVDLNDERLLKEVALFAERADISEELARLRSHFSQLRQMLAAREPAGRAMDFLCQELHREFNTIASKASDAEIARHVIEGKTEVERLREQVQNVE